MTTIITVSSNNEVVCFVMEEGASTMVERRVGAKLVARSHYPTDEGIDILNMYLKEGYRMVARRVVEQ